MDLSGYDGDYVKDVLNGFFEQADLRRKKLIGIKMSATMLASLDLGQGIADTFFRSVPVTIGTTGFEDTIEVTIASSDSEDKALN
jgi:malate/lactate dehydrogenase